MHPWQRLGVHPSPAKGDVFSPIFGRITEINERSIFVEAVEPDEELRAAAQAVEKVDLLSMPERGGELVPILKGLGLNTKSLGQECETLIINGLNPDPGVTWAEPMLLAHQRNLHNGLEMLRRLSPAKRILLAVPKEIRLQHHDVEIVHVPSHYPASVNALVIKAVTGREQPEGVGIVGLHNVWSLGRVTVTGLPLTETVITIGSFTHSGNYIVTKGATGVFVVEAGSVPAMEGHSPCINCGACVLVCPARLSPNLLSRYAEFALHERARKEYVEQCLECGLCGYVCIARRPVLQYIRLAKHKLADADAARRLEELKPVGQEDAASGAAKGGN